MHVPQAMAHAREALFCLPLILIRDLFPEIRKLSDRFGAGGSHEVAAVGIAHGIDTEEFEFSGMTVFLPTYHAISSTPRLTSYRH